MSIVSDFAKAMHGQAASMIGVESVVIGETTLLCVLAEASITSDFAAGGFDAGKTLTATCRTSTLPAESILKKSATARGETWRVDSISKGGTFTTFTLSVPTRS